MPTIHESPKAIKKQRSTPTPPRHSSLHVSHGIPNKPNPPPQVSPQAAKNSTSVSPPPPPQSGSSSVSPPSSQDSVFKSPDAQKTEQPQTEQQNKSFRNFPLVKAATVGDVSESKLQTDKLAKQFNDEENIRPPSQFDSPARTSTYSAEDENLSPFAIELRKASKAREERILTNQPRMLTTTNRQEHNESEEEESIAITAQVQAGGNPITSSTIKQDNKTDSVSGKAVSVNTTHSTDTQEMQQSKDSPQNGVSNTKIPVTNLIKQFSGDLSNTQETTRLTHTNVEKTYKNFDKQHPGHNMVSTSTETKGNPKSVTMIAKAFEGEKADDGTYNWRGNLKSVSKSSVVKSSTPNVEDESESTNVYERTTNRQMQGSSFTKKPSKTSLLAKKFEQNPTVKSESIPSKKVEKMLQQSLSEASTEEVKHLPASMTEQKFIPLVEDSLKLISNNENATSPVEKDSDGENDALVGQTVVSLGNESLRRQSAVVMCEEAQINFPANYERNSVSVDTDYWKSPEHAANLPAVSEVPTQVSHLPDKTTDTEILPEPDLDILPPPIMTTDEELAFSIEDLPLPEFLPPPEIDDFHEFQDLPPPPVDFPDDNFCQDTPSFDITVSSNMHNTDTFELPSPSQLPPHYGTDSFELPSPSQLPSPYDTDNFEIPSPSQLPPHDDTGNFELPPPLLEEGPSDRDGSSLAAEFHNEESSALEDKDENRTDDNKEYSPLSSTTKLPSVTMTDSHSMPSHVFEDSMCDDITLQTPSSPLHLSDMPVPQDGENVPSVNPDQHLSHDIHEMKPSEDDVSQVCCTSVCKNYLFLCTLLQASILDDNLFAIMYRTKNHSLKKLFCIQL